MNLQKVPNQRLVASHVCSKVQCTCTRMYSRGVKNELKCQAIIKPLTFGISTAISTFKSGFVPVSRR